MYLLNGIGTGEYTNDYLFDIWLSFNPIDDSTL